MIDHEEFAPAPAAHGSAAAGTGEELLSAAVDLPWDDWLGEGASDRVRDGSLGLIRHAYPATAARDLRAAATGAGLLHGNAATRERLAAVALGIAAAHHRPARLPHRPDREPHAWWIAEERTLVWMPWAGGDPAYGFELLRENQAEAVTVIAPDACWTVFRSGLPERGARGGWDSLPPRLRTAVAPRLPAGGEASLRWHRSADAVHLSWSDGEHRRRLRIDLHP